MGLAILHYRCYINRLHQVVIAYVYDNCGDFSEGLTYVGIDSEEGARYGCMDRNGKECIHMIYDHIDLSHPGNNIDVEGKRLRGE